MADNHIIVAAYDGGGYTKTRPAYQYDYGQVLRLEDFGDLLPDSFEMHFSIGNGQAITRIGTDGEVGIPNVCLERYGTVTAWLFLHDTANDGETKYVIETPVRSRGRTTGQEPTPQEQSVITQAIAALNSGVEAAQEAQQGAEEARTGAENAADSIMNASADAESLDAGVPATASVTNDDGVITFHIGIPKGDTGDAPIDDTAGMGAGSVVWSADKSYNVAAGKADRTDTVLDTTLSRGRSASGNTGAGSVAFGNGNVASGAYSQAFGDGTSATWSNASATGYRTTASGAASSAEGIETTADGDGGHSEGNSTTASGDAAHAENEYTSAIGDASHAQGSGTTASGFASDASGLNTVASGSQAVASGEGTIAQGNNQRVSGRYNVADTEQGGQYAEIVGKGTGNNARSNAAALDWAGNARFAGDVYVGCGTDSTGGSKLAKESQIPNVSGKLDKPTVAGANGQVLTSNGRGGQTWQTPATVPQIDDTAGTGDTGKLWSANKIASEIGSLSDELDDKYEKPSSGIPASDLASGVIPDVSGFYTKPSGGIPASDLANGVIPDVSGKQNAPTTAGTAGQVLGLDNGLNPVWMTQSGGSTIDDTAGTGDTTKVWSANKSASELQTLNSALNVLEPTATSGDVGKTLVVKTVSGGKATEYEFGEAITLDDTLTHEGEAADAKSAGDKIGQLREDVDTLNEGGLVLKDEVIRDQIDNWLDDHPEATTTVEDGSITLPKLNNALKDYVVIEQETENGYFHDIAPQSISFYPDSRVATESCKYVGSANLIEGKYEAGDQNGVTKTVDGRFLKLKGTQNSGQLRFFIFDDAATLNKVKGKTVNLYLYIKKSTNWEAGSKLQLTDGVGNPILSSFSANTNKFIGWSKFENLNISANATQLYLRIQSASGNVFADGDFAWVGVYETIAVDTEHVIDGEDPYTISVSEISYVDTTLHTSKCKFISPTKTYVDEHTPDIIGYWTDEIYALPEKFGAVGDGVADDAQALSDCISYAITSKKAIRGYGKYKTSLPITLNAQYLDAYFREITYTGNGNAVEIQHMDIRFEFHRIVSSNVGISFENNGGSPARYARRCVVKGNEIASVGDCVACHGMTLYNTVDIRYLSSSNANCIIASLDSLDFGAGEYVFRSSSCACPNGYVIKDLNNSKIYDFTIERNCKYGLLNPGNCVCVGFRHREQTDGMALRLFSGASYNNGPLIAFTEPPNGDGMCGFKFITSDNLPWFAIDTSAISGFDPIPTGTGATDNWHKIAYSGVTIGTPIRGASEKARINIGADMCFIGNNKVLIPSGRKTVTITNSTCDFRPLDGNTDEEIVSAYSVIEKMGTDFLLDVAHADIYLNASFGAIGYNDLTLTQEDGNTATIYDKLGNVLFDGTNEGDGKWRFVCTVDTSSCGRLPYTTVWWCYDGTNEKWEITKLS